MLCEGRTLKPKSIFLRRTNLPQCCSLGIMSNIGSGDLFGDEQFGDVLSPIK